MEKSDSNLFNAKQNPGSFKGTKLKRVAQHHQSCDHSPESSGVKSKPKLGNSTHIPPEKWNQTEKSQTVQKLRSCKYCKEVHPWGSANCPAFRKFCTNCLQKNHTSTACWSKNKGKSYQKSKCLKVSKSTPITKLDQKDIGKSPSRKIDQKITIKHESSPNSISGGFRNMNMETSCNRNEATDSKGNQIQKVQIGRNESKSEKQNEVPENDKSGGIELSAQAAISISTQEGNNSDDTKSYAAKAKINIKQPKSTQKEQTNCLNAED